MYAIFKSGGKQYRVKKDQIVDVELVPGEEGSEVEFNDIQFVSTGEAYKVGGPTVEGSVVKGKLMGTVPGPKVTSVKFTRRKGQRTKWGHRQKYSRVKIEEIIA